MKFARNVFNSTFFYFRTDLFDKFFKKIFFYVLGFLSVSLFLIENIKIYPYQYVWFNTPSRYLDLTKKFELEYMGINGKEISKKYYLLIMKIFVF